MHFYGTDLSANGTALNPSTGAIVVAANVDDETGYAVISLNGVWLEANNGCALRVFNATGLLLSLKNVTLAANENIAGVGAVNIGAIASSEISNVIAGGALDNIYIAAARSTVVGSVIATLNDTSTRYRHINVTTSLADIADTFKDSFKRMKLLSQDFVYGRSDQISGGGTNDVDFYLYGTGTQRFLVNGTRPLTLGSNAIGFYGTTPAAKPTITGAKSGNAALTSLLTQLAALGLITDSTT